MAFHNVPPNGFPDLPDVEELESVVKDVTNLKTSVSGLSEDVSDLNDNKANQITIAPFFDEETAYEVGDLVYYNGLSYRCTNAHEGEWDADDFAATTISNELASLMSGLNDRLPKGTIVGTDADTITGMGCWIIKNTTANHMPGNDNSDYVLCHIGNSDFAIQICQIYKGSGSTNTYIRQLINGWGEWNQFSLV